MADWRQIQARIRKAKTGTNAAEKLAELYQRTSDAMVAFELARFQENNGDSVEAVKWYTAAAQHFRRAQWRVKAEEALTRLGAPIPPPLPPAIEPSRATGEPPPSESGAGDAAPSMEPSQEMDTSTDFEEADTQPASAQTSDSSAEGERSGAPEDPQAPGKRRRRRGRRGGRNRRRGGAAVAAGSAPAGPERPAGLPSSRYFQPSPAPPRDAEADEPQPKPAPRREYAPEPAYDPAAASAPAASAGHSWQGTRGRAGEPALASRMAQLESQLRRLLACPLSSLGDADQAPAGPGVLLLSDSDQVTHYYIEACQTLRIGIGNLLRGSRGGKGGGRLKELMAENLGIGESRVSKYLKDHCAVRWLQLDEGAPELAHFAMAVLRPVVTE